MNIIHNSFRWMYVWKIKTKSKYRLKEFDVKNRTCHYLDDKIKDRDISRLIIY